LKIQSFLYKIISRK